jgi:hypothetical protein
MNKGDVLLDRGADRLQELANRAAARGDGVGEWLSEELRNDAAFLRKLKPSLVKARAKGNAPTPPPAPSGPQLGTRPGSKKKKKRKKGGKGPAPLLIVGAALVAGIVLAKVVDWRGHAHPRD